MMRVGILGASGYVGGELLRILSSHPEVEIVYVTGERAAGLSIPAIHHHLAGLASHVFETYDASQAIKLADVFFSALPHGTSMSAVPGLLDAGRVVFDLSADFRLQNVEEYEETYATTHEAPGLIARAVYGLPELFPGNLDDAQLVAIPGCYPTATLLALGPLAKHGVAFIDGIVVDAKSGVSGAGRREETVYSYCERTANLAPYSPVNHRHVSEIEEKLGELAHGDAVITFVPHLIPMARGMVVTAYVNLRKEFTQDGLESLYRDFYADHRFVEVLRDRCPDTKAVLGSNRCNLAVRIGRRADQAVVMAAIDNLGKGAAGNAVQCFNLRFGFPEDLGLAHSGFAP